MNSLTKIKVKAKDIWFTDDILYVRLEDGREIGTPLAWFPKLLSATKSQRDSWKLIGNGIGIHWAEIDEDISVEALIQ